MIKRIPHCSHWGAYTLLVDAGKIVGVEPFTEDPAPSPIINSVSEWANPARRVLKPLVRAGWLEKREQSDRRQRGRERFVEVSWETATTLVAEEIKRVSGQFGNASIFGGSYGWTNCGRFHHASSQLKRMLNLVGGYTGHVDTYSVAAGPVILRHTLGNDDACNGKASSLETIAANTETLLVFGAMTPRTAQNEAGGLGQHLLQSSLERIASRGIKVVHVSPLKDDLPDQMNADWWPIRPNTDTALMLGLAAEIVLSNRHDRDFLQRCTSGSDKFLAYLNGSADGIAKNADWAAGITGLNAGAIRSLATRLVDTRSMVTVSWSLQRAHHGEHAFWAALGLASVIGQIGLPGGGVGYGYGSLGGVGAPINLGKSPALPHGRKPNSDFIPVARITDLLLNPGKAFSYQGETRRYPDTRLVYWSGGNPFHHHQDLNRLNQAWMCPETIIVQDPMFTATAQRADIVLPASTSIERNDLAASRRSDFIVAMHKAIEPLGLARSDFEICSEISDRLGVHDAFTQRRDEMQWIEHLYNETRDDAASRLGVEMPDFEHFWQTGHARCPSTSQHTYLADYRENPQAHALKTESGKIVLGSQTLAELAYPDCPAIPTWMEPVEWLGNGNGQQLHLISHQPRGRLHSQLETAAVSLATKRNGREQASMHPDDAAARGIRDGQTIRLWNQRGACLATAQLSDTVREGVIVLPTGAWFTPAGESGLDLSGNPNVLTIDIPTSAFGQGCAAHTCLVSVEPYDEPAPVAWEAYAANAALLTT